MNQNLTLEVEPLFAFEPPLNIHFLSNSSLPYITISKFYASPTPMISPVLYSLQGRSEPSCSGLRDGYSFHTSIEGSLVGVKASCFLYHLPQNDPGSRRLLALLLPEGALLERNVRTLLRSDEGEDASVLAEGVAVEEAAHPELEESYLREWPCRSRIISMGCFFWIFLISFLMAWSSGSL